MTVFTNAIPDSPAGSATAPGTTSPRYDARMLGGGGVVPYVALWSGEQTLPSRVIERAPWGIGYTDELPTDRDNDGVLWTRVTTRPGHGRPLYRQMHPLRQRRAMRRLLCQVCARLADHTDQGHLWLLLDCWRDTDAWPEHVVNPYPPVCLECARMSARLCPPLRRGYIAVRAHSTLHGVIGVRFQAARPYPAVRLAADDGGQPVAYGDQALRWTQATQLTRTLHHCTPVDLNQPAATDGRSSRQQIVGPAL